jgi:hypothetical protein
MFDILKLKYQNKERKILKTFGSFKIKKIDFDTNFYHHEIYIAAYKKFFFFIIESSFK